MQKLRDGLAGGDRRSIGKANQVVRLVLDRPSRFGELFHCLFVEDPVVRMRAADALEKISADRPSLLKPYKKRLLLEVAPMEQQEVRWHVAQMISRLELTRKEREQAFGLIL